MHKSMQQENHQFEYIRAFATIAVITIHTMYSALIQFGDSATNFSTIIYRVVMNSMWWAVPCFLMMTGSLLLDCKKSIPIKKIYNKYIARMIIVLFTFGVVFSWMELLFETKTISISQIPKAVFYVFTGNTWAHMWYIYCLLGLYVLLPLYKLIANHASNEQLKYILLVLFVFESVFKLTKIFNVNLGFYCHINTIYPFWLLMGAAWNRGMFNRKIGFNISLLSISTILLIIATVMHITIKSPFNSLFGYDSIFVVVQSVAVFSLFNSIGTNIKLDKLLCEIGDKSFGIYLIHMVFINIAYKLFKINPFNSFLSVGLILIIINLIFSYIVASIMKRLPVFKKII